MHSLSQPAQTSPQPLHAFTHTSTSYVQHIALYYFTSSGHRSFKEIERWENMCSPIFTHIFTASEFFIPLALCDHCPYSVVSALTESFSSFSSKMTLSCLQRTFSLDEDFRVHLFFSNFFLKLQIPGSMQLPQISTASSQLLPATANVLLGDSFAHT